MVEILLALYFVWVVGHLLLMIFMRPNVPCCNGFAIHIPEWVATKLEPVEAYAVYLHELAHLRHMHVWKNFALVCVFMRPSFDRRQAQEFEADDFVASSGFGFAMASALRKLSISPYDNIRARRLEMKGPREVGNPRCTGCAVDE